VDQSSRDLFPKTQEESVWKTALFDLDILNCSGDIRNQIRTSQKNRPKFGMFLALNMF